MNIIFNNLINLVTNNFRYIILPIIYIIIGTISFSIIKNILKKATKFQKATLKSHQKQRINTVYILILNIIKYIIVILVVLLILATYGVNIKSILAGLGIGTAIIGLAFQDLAKDIIAGIFIISEDQYEVGQTIEVDGFMGEVVFVGLKTTRIKNYKGAVKIISNRNMDKIINYSLNNSLALVDVSVAYEHTPDEVFAVFEKLTKKLQGKYEEAKGDLQIIGIDSLDDSSVVYRLGLEVDPMTHLDMERKLKRDIMDALNEANIKIPYPQIEVHNGK